MDSIILFLQSVFMYLTAYFLIRINRKGIGELTTYDFTLFIILGTVAANPLKADSIPSTLIALLGLWTGHFITVLLARVNLFRPLLTGKPRHLVAKGHFNAGEFLSSKLTLSELYSSLRQNGHTGISQMEWLVLEPSGKLSFLPKSKWEPTNLAPGPLVMDGVVQIDTLQASGKSFDWLNSELKSQGVEDVKQLLIAELSSPDKLFIVRR